MTIDATRDQPHHLALSAVPSQVINVLRDFWKSLGRHAEMRRAERASQTMDATVLRDIGIDRSAVMAILYAPQRERDQSHDSV